jgi:hypothetical protein
VPGRLNVLKRRCAENAGAISGVCAAALDPEKRRLGYRMPAENAGAIFGECLAAHDPEKRKFGYRMPPKMQQQFPAASRMDVGRKIQQLVSPGLRRVQPETPRPPRSRKIHANGLCCQSGKSGLIRSKECWWT